MQYQQMNIKWPARQIALTQSNCFEEMQCFEATVGLASQSCGMHLPREKCIYLKSQGSLTSHARAIVSAACRYFCTDAASNISLIATAAAAAAVEHMRR